MYIHGKPSVQCQKKGANPGQLVSGFDPCTCTYIRMHMEPLSNKDTSAKVTKDHTFHLLKKRTPF